MANVHLLYGRPLAADDEPPPLRVTGSLPSFQPGAAYEGRLQIIDAIGDCKVEMVESDLPPGAYAYVDNVADEVVLKWPTWSPPHDLATEVPNGGFESGDDGHWYKPAGWAIEPSGAHTGTYAAVYRGRGTSSLSGTMVPVVPDTSITATAQIQQGASSAGNVVARIILIYYDLARRTQGGEGEGFFGGNLVRSGSHGAWHPSTVTAVAPPWAAYVGVDVSANRKRQNKPLWVDDITWNHVYSVGVNWLYDFTVTFKVTDSANRVAYWSGAIGYQSVLARSQRYPVTATDYMAITPLFFGASTKDGLLSTDAGHDEIQITPLFVSAITKSLNWAHTQPPEELSIAPLFVSASTKPSQWAHAQPAEDFLSIAPVFASASTKQVLVTNTLQAEAITITPLFIGASTSA